MNKFVLYRILGNDLPPRHAEGQTLANLRFILDHEPELPGCEKRWVVNRIFDPKVEESIRTLLDESDQRYLFIPFIGSEYAACSIRFDGLPKRFYLYTRTYHRIMQLYRLRLEEWCFAERNRYLMNNNGARNAALADGRTVAEWVLPFDGNCFFTRQAWDEFAAAAENAGDARYLIVPMARITDNNLLLTDGFRPEADEEPQIAFRHDAGEKFDERCRYGAMPKASLLYRLGVPGRWQEYGVRQPPWEKIDLTPSRDANRFVYAGWVARLYSGNAPAEADNFARFTRRLQSIIQFCSQADERIMRGTYSSSKLCFFDDAVLRQQREVWRRGGKGIGALVDELERVAGEALNAPLLTLAGLAKDSINGRAESLWSEQDKDTHGTAWSSFLEQLTALVLCAYFRNDRRYLECSAELARAWFIASQTRIEPNFKLPIAGGARAGVNAGKGLLYLAQLPAALDALRVMGHGRILNKREMGLITRWFKEFQKWLTKSPPGLLAYTDESEVGTCHDLVSVAVSLFVGDLGGARYRLNVAKMRMAAQLESGSGQASAARSPVSDELVNLQLWASLARIAPAAGIDLSRYTTTDGQSLHSAALALASRARAGKDLSAEEGTLVDLLLESFPDPKDRSARIAAGAGVPSGPRWVITPFWRLGFAPVPRTADTRTKR